MQQYVQAYNQRIAWIIKPERRVKKGNDLFQSNEKKFNIKWSPVANPLHDTIIHSPAIADEALNGKKFRHPKYIKKYVSITIIYVWIWNGWLTANTTLYIQHNLLIQSCLYSSNPKRIRKFQKAVCLFIRPDEIDGKGKLSLQITINTILSSYFVDLQESTLFQFLQKAGE